VEEISRPEIAVVIPSRNAESRLEVTLASLRNQSLEADRYEIIVVDDRSTDATGAVAAANGARVVRVQGAGGIAAARNAGASATRAPLVAFTDDDCEADIDWLGNVLAAFSDPDVDGVGGCVVPGPGDTFVRRYLAARNPVRATEADLLGSASRLFRLWLYMRAAVFGPRPIGAGEELYSAVGANMAMRRELVFELGGFDEGDLGSEEEDLWRRARAREGGALVRYVADAVITHRFGPELGACLRRSRRYGRAHARLAAKHDGIAVIVYPSPVVLLGLLIAATVTRRTRVLASALLFPLVAYPRWARDLLRSRSLETACYPYLDMVGETAYMVGELAGAPAGYVPVASLQLDAAAISADAPGMAVSPGGGGQSVFSG
jgi:GT2 family glycosyltransferase